MKKLVYTIKDKNGIHARPAGLIVRCAKKYDGKIEINYGGKTADCSKLFSIMLLGIKCGDVIEITADGERADEILDEMENVMEEAGL